MKKLGVTSELIILIITMGFMGAGVGLFGILKISESNSNLKIVCEEAFSPFQKLKTVSFIFGSNILIDLEKLAKQEIDYNSGRDQINSKFSEVEGIIDEFRTDPNYPNEALSYKQVQQHIRHLKPNLNNLLNQISNKGVLDAKQFEIVLSDINKIQSGLNTLSELQITQANYIQNKNLEDFAKSKIYFALILLAGVIISMLLAFYILVGIKANLKSTNRLLRKISSGDLSTKIVRRGGKDFGELHDNLRHLSDKFTEILAIAQLASNNINITSQQLSSNSQYVSEGANQQAASVEEIAASMEQISSRVQENMSNTLSAQKISSKVVKDVEVGNENIRLTVDAIKSIADKISIVSDIAFQTNILALNAAVEAARAGEHGRGFGVVAAEVGKLADRSKVAAIDINTLSQSGVGLGLESRSLLTELVDEIKETSNLVSKVTEANLEQNSGINEVNSSIQMLNHITQDNAATSEEMAAVSEQMADQAQRLRDSIQYFKFSKQEVSATKSQKHLTARTDNQ